jgi:hypothetical protein
MHATAIVAATAHASNAHTSNAHTSNTHTLFLFFLYRQMHVRRYTRNAGMQQMHAHAQQHEQYLFLSLSLLLSFTLIKHFFLHNLWIQCGLMASRLSCGQSNLGSIPALGKLFSINCETLNFHDFVSVFSSRDWFW